MQGMMAQGEEAEAAPEQAAEAPAQQEQAPEQAAPAPQPQAESVAAGKKARSPCAPLCCSTLPLGI